MITALDTVVVADTYCEVAHRSLDETVKRLARHRGDSIVTSFYLDVDGKRWPRPAALEEKADLLLRRARHKADRLGVHDSLAAHSDLQRIRTFLDDEFDRDGARGLAIFSCVAQDMFEVITLPATFHDQVSFGLRPSVGQLVGVLDGCDPVLVTLVDHETARFLKVHLGMVEEETALIDPRERQADTGVELGSFERRAQEEVLRHLRRAARETVREVEGGHFSTVLVGGPTDSTARFLDLLPPSTRRKAMGTFAVSMQASEREVLDAARPIIEDAELSDEAGLIDLLFDRATKDRRAVVGLPATLDALGDERVATLVVARDFSATGAQCDTCSLLQVSNGTCSRCGGALEPVEEVVEAAIEQAVEQKAAVRVCADGDVDIFGSIGAFVRF